MGLFDKFRNWLGGARATIAPADASRATVEPMNLGVVYRCVNVISDSVAMLPLHVYRVDSAKLEKESGDVQNVINSPNDYTTRFWLVKMLLMSKLLQGNGYAWIKRNRDGAVAEIVYLNNARVNVVKTTDVRGNVKVEYLVKDFKRVLQADELIHLKNYSTDGVVGISTIAHAARSINIASGGEDQAKNYFDGDGRPSGVLGIEGVRLTTKDKEDIREAWRNQMKRKGSVVILEGNQHYTPITISPADAQLLESRAYSVVDICRFFGVSPVKCFDLSKSSYSTVEATELAFLNDTLLPIITDVEEELTKKLFIGSERGKYVVKFDVEVLLRADKTAQSSYYSTMVSRGLLTPNEVREKIGYGPIGGGDVAYMQTANAPLETLKKIKLNGTTSND